MEVMLKPDSRVDNQMRGVKTRMRPKQDQYMQMFDAYLRHLPNP